MFAGVEELPKVPLAVLAESLRAVSLCLHARQENVLVNGEEVSCAETPGIVGVDGRHGRFVGASLAGGRPGNSVFGRRSLAVSGQTVWFQESCLAVPNLLPALS